MPACGLGHAAANVIANVVYRKDSIRVVDISCNAIGDSGAYSFSNLLTHSDRIISLNLGSNAITDLGGEAIFSAMCRNYSVIELNVGNSSGVGRNSLQQKSCEALGKMLTMNRVLSVLNVSMTEITADTVQLFCTGLAQNQTLHSLDISNNNIQSRGGIALVAACRKSRLRELSIASNHLRDDTAPVISSLLTRSEIRQIDLTGNSFTKRFMEKISRTMETSKLQTLNISMNPITGEGLAYLGHPLSCNDSLKHLIAVNCQIDKQGIIDFCNKFWFNEGLISLNISRNPIIDDGMIELAKVIEIHPRLKAINLESCGLSEPGGIKLFAAVAKSPALKSISIRNNLITCGVKMYSAVLANSRIFFLDIDYNTIDYKVMVDIQKRVAENVRTWKRSRKSRIQGRVASLSQVVGTLRNTCNEIVVARRDIAEMGEKIEQMTVEAMESEAHRNEVVGELASKLETTSKLAMDERDRHHETVMQTWTNRELRETEVSRLTHESEGSVETWKRESKALADLTARVTERQDIMAISMDGLDKRVMDARLRYLEARDMLAKSWKLARWSRGLAADGKLPKQRTVRKLQKQMRSQAETESEQKPEPSAGVTEGRTVTRRESDGEFAMELERISVPKAPVLMAKTLGVGMLASVISDSNLQKNRVALNAPKLVKPVERRKQMEVVRKSPSLSTHEFPGELPGL
jgi:Ran GTPase-activating protein (RanGAP) involved in mRNA processing and transport